MKHILAAALFVPIAAVAAAFPDLPPAAAVAGALRTHPAVRAAAAGIDAAAANRDRLDAGPHEFVLRLGSSQRRDLAVDRRLAENEVGIERTLRLPHKAAKDAAIGATVQEQAQAALGDALHESARLLLKRWFDWRRAHAVAADWRIQVDILSRQAEVAAKRVAAGDAARVDAMLAQAQLTQAEAQLARAESGVAMAAQDLRQEFPAIALPDQVPDPEPEALVGDFAAWRERILEHSHELAYARLDARRQQLLAQRQDFDRLPDPTLGMRWSSERDGQEKVLGIGLSFPLAGSARAAMARGAEAEAEAAAAREALALTRIDGEARRAHAQALAEHAQWQRLGAVAARYAENAELLDKAWRLGEGRIDELLTARRLAAEARLAATQARLDARQARYRLLLDTHQLWPLGDDAEPPAR